MQGSLLFKIETSLLKVEMFFFKVWLSFSYIILFTFKSVMVIRATPKIYFQRAKLSFNLNLKCVRTAGL